jgi:hypothetical protein
MATPADSTPDHDAAASPEDGLTWTAIVEAAEQAERADGGEETESAVRSHILIRAARISLASCILVAGLTMLVLPGPGWLVIAVGLALLSRDVAWAERWLVAVRKRVPGARPDGTLPSGVWATIIVMALAGTAVGLWFAFR